MCLRTKKFLRQNSIQFTEINVLTHPKALWKLATEFRSMTPVVVVGDEPISGFNRKRLCEELGLAER